LHRSFRRRHHRRHPSSWRRAHLSGRRAVPAPHETSGRPIATAGAAGQPASLAAGS
jgi:hypothetical protein